MQPSAKTFSDSPHLYLNGKILLFGINTESLAMGIEERIDDFPGRVMATTVLVQHDGA